MNHPREFLERLLTIKDVSDRTQLSETYIYAAASSGKLTGHRFGRAWRFTISDVQDWQRRQRKLSINQVVMR